MNKANLLNPLDPELARRYPISYSNPVKQKVYKSVVALESFIKYYVPKGWRGPIHEFDFAPFISEEEFKLILTGVIPSDKKFDRWYVKDAIHAWLEMISKEYKE